MAEPYVGEIRMFGGNYAPVGWALCNGQLLAVQSYDTLYSLIGTIYGGDGVNNFALPDLRGRVPMHYGAGPGLSNRTIGERQGLEYVGLDSSTLPGHSHSLQASKTPGAEVSPANHVLANTSLYTDSPATCDMDSDAITTTGGNNQHINMQPYSCINFIIATVGIYPPRH